jgi:hypothetical protein
MGVAAYRKTALSEYTREAPTREYTHKHKQTHMNAAPDKVKRNQVVRLSRHPVF